MSSSAIQQQIPQSFPSWLRQPLPDTTAYDKTKEILKQYRLHTVCEDARCPNLGQCWSRGTATFMIMGQVCTRTCRFCGVTEGNSAPLDVQEPERIASAIADLKLSYCVVTSVTRDDLPDGGAEHFVATIQAVRALNSKVRIEVLVPDFRGQREHILKVAESGPDVFGHNLETVRALSAEVRPQADYQRSLAVLKQASDHNKELLTKSGLMLGMGEGDLDIRQAIADLADVGCDILTLGQYLRPASNSKALPVKRFVHPEEFEAYKEFALRQGIKTVAAGPLVRSSFLAEQVYDEIAKALTK